MRYVSSIGVRFFFSRIRDFRGVNNYFYDFDFDRHFLRHGIFRKPTLIRFDVEFNLILTTKRFSRISLRRRIVLIVQKKKKSL